ncbi:MAG: hypothetical protein CME65_13000 [Halobacteriovoraceae bacterium]|nr:hypothetical protein [Halobacteriovoraceae bacterium]|tara:strand:- start:2224 stop:3555 length:1332 start_codon:yes stop_codon:yes gene_type:complete
MISRTLLLLILFSCARVPLSQTKPEAKKVAIPSFKNSSTNLKDIQGCSKQVQYFRLLSKLSDKSFKVLNQLNDEELCVEYYSKTKNLLSKHQNKIGIIYTGTDEVKNKAIIEGLKTAKKNGDFLISRVNFDKEAINKTLAKMILEQRVGLIVTWGPDKMLDYIQKWQNGLRIPTIYINKEINKNQHAFKLYPNKANYAFEMLKELRKRNIKRIAILTPLRYKKAKFIQDMKKVFKAAKIDIVFDVTFDSTNYDSMDIACREIFVIDRFKRRGEYNSIYRKEKRKASAQGFQLNKKLVFLPAQVNFDAIFIPDNFKIVNHFAKLFQYYKARRITLFGTHEWRSHELVETNKNFLNGSFFVDFVDSPEKYNESRLSTTLDYKLMGYYSGVIGRNALSKTNSNRELVTKKLKAMKFSKDETAFRRQEFNWPAYAFEIQKNQIIPSN